MTLKRERSVGGLCPSSMAMVIDHPKSMQFSVQWIPPFEDGIYQRTCFVG